MVQAREVVLQLGRQHNKINLLKDVLFQVRTTSIQGCNGETCKELRISWTASKCVSQRERLGMRIYVHEFLDNLCLSIIRIEEVGTNRREAPTNYERIDSTRVTVSTTKVIYRCLGGHI